MYAVVIIGVRREGAVESSRDRWVVVGGGATFMKLLDLMPAHSPTKNCLLLKKKFSIECPQPSTNPVAGQSHRLFALIRFCTLLGKWGGFVVWGGGRMVSRRPPDIYLRGRHWMEQKGIERRLWRVQKRKIGRGNGRADLGNFGAPCKVFFSAPV